METQKAVAAYLATLVGLADSSMRVYAAYLRTFAAAFPTLPTDRDALERYLEGVAKTQSSRTIVRRTIGRLFAYLVEQGELAESPIPRGKVGRPKKRVPVRADEMVWTTRVKLVRDHAGRVTGFEFLAELCTVDDKGRSSVVGTVGPIRTANVQDLKRDLTDDPPDPS